MADKEKVGKMSVEGRIIHARSLQNAVGPASFIHCLLVCVIIWHVILDSPRMVTSSTFTSSLAQNRMPRPCPGPLTWPHPPYHPIPCPRPRPHPPSGSLFRPY